jgi:hypothetical protein
VSLDKIYFSTSLITPELSQPWILNGESQYTEILTEQYNKNSLLRIQSPDPMKVDLYNITTFQILNYGNYTTPNTAMFAIFKEFNNTILKAKNSIFNIQKNSKQFSESYSEVPVYIKSIQEKMNLFDTFFTDFNTEILDKWIQIVSYLECFN